MSPEAIKEAVESQFVFLLSNAGTTVDEPELFRTWQAFKAFAHATVEQTHGVSMFECGNDTVGESLGHFYVHFLRLFYLEVEEGWDDIMVNCNFEFESVPELCRFKVDIQMDTGAAPEPGAFLAEIETQHELWQALKNHIVLQAWIQVV